jgi:cytochrome c553
MPVFPEGMLSDSDLEDLYAYLQALREDAPPASAESTSSP